MQVLCCSRVGDISMEHWLIAHEQVKTFGVVYQTCFRNKLGLESTIFGLKELNLYLGCL